MPSLHCLQQGEKGEGTTTRWRYYLKDVLGFPLTYMAIKGGSSSGIINIGGWVSVDLCPYISDGELLHPTIVVSAIHHGHYLEGITTIAKARNSHRLHKSIETRGRDIDLGRLKEQGRSIGSPLEVICDGGVGITNNISIKGGRT